MSTENAAIQASLESLARYLGIRPEELRENGLSPARPGYEWATYALYAEACLEAASLPRGGVIFHPLFSLPKEPLKASFEMISHTEKPKLANFIGMEASGFNCKALVTIGPLGADQIILTPSVVSDLRTGRRLVAEKDAILLQQCPMSFQGRYRLMEVVYGVTPESSLSSTLALNLIRIFLGRDTQFLGAPTNEHRVDEIEIRADPELFYPILFRSAHSVQVTQPFKVKVGEPYAYQGASLKFSIEHRLNGIYCLFIVNARGIHEEHIEIRLPMDIPVIQGLALPRATVRDPYSRLLDSQEEMQVTNWVNQLIALSKPLEKMTGLL